MDRFSVNNKKPDKKDAYCKACKSEWKKAYAKSKQMTATKHRIDLELLKSMLAKGCEICGITTSKLTVDHDHACCSGHRSCGKCIRGILCDKCNKGMGFFNDDPNLLNQAIQYLKTSAIFSTAS